MKYNIFETEIQQFETELQDFKLFFGSTKNEIN